MIMFVSLFLAFILYSMCGYAQIGQSYTFVDSLLSKMTLEQKIGQMNQENFTGINDEILCKIREGKIGSFLNVTSLSDAMELQKAAMESEYGIPLLLARDVIHGYKTIFPIPLGLAATFDDKLVEKCAYVSAKEAAENGINWTFSPMIDIARDPRWGRVAESFGEDVYLTSSMGSAMIRGYQGEELSENSLLAACAKHFVGYGSVEGGRDYNSTNISLKTLMNVYIPPFKKAIDDDVASIMPSFNDNDGLPAIADSSLLKDILRTRLHFNGLTVSDWNAVHELMIHGLTDNGKGAAKISLKSGLDMEMYSGYFSKFLKELVENGEISIDLINNAVKNILTVKYKLGLFNDKNVIKKQEQAKNNLEHIYWAKQAALESFVLLKNENRILPINKKTKIAIVGPMADASFDQLGTWIFDGDVEKTITPLKALKSFKYENLDFIYDPIINSTLESDTSNFYKIETLLNQVDMTVVFLGEASSLSGEAHSLSDISLKGSQTLLLKKIKEFKKPIILIVMAGRPLVIKDELSYADAVLYGFHPGMMGGEAVWDLITGRSNPSGKLPITFVNDVGQIPMYYSHNNTGRPATNEVYTLNNIGDKGQTSSGSVSYYLDSGVKPLFPFGYGLSYSSFKYSNLKLSKDKMGENDSINVSITLENESDIPGVEVVQLYVRDKVSSITRPVKELKRYKRVYLNANEKKIVTFTLYAKDLAFYNIENNYTVEKGDFCVGIGGNSNLTLDKNFNVW